MDQTSTIFFPRCEDFFFIDTIYRISHSKHNKIPHREHTDLSANRIWFTQTESNMAVPGEAGNRTEVQVSLLHQRIERPSKRLVIAPPSRLIPCASAQWAQILTSGHLTSSLCPSIPQNGCCFLCLLISDCLSVYCLHF